MVSGQGLKWAEHKYILNKRSENGFEPGEPGSVWGSTSLATSYWNRLWEAKGHRVTVRGLREQRLCALRNRRAQRIGQLHHFAMAQLSILSLKSTLNPISLFKQFENYIILYFRTILCFHLSLSPSSVSYVPIFSFHTSFPKIRLALCQLDVHSQPFFSSLFLFHGVPRALTVFQ